MLPLLDELGIRLLCTLSGDARYREVQSMQRAEVNIMVCSKAMLSVARKLESQFGTPWFEGSFYGITDTTQALRDFAPLIGDPDLTARTEALIAREEARIRAQLESWKQRLTGRRVLLNTGGVKSWWCPPCRIWGWWWSPPDRANWPNSVRNVEPRPGR